MGLRHLAACLLLAPGLSGCIFGGPAVFAQDHLDSLESVTVHLDGTERTWEPVAGDGELVALEALIALYPAQPEENATRVPLGQVQQGSLSETSWVRMAVAENASLETFEADSQELSDLEEAYFELGPANEQEGTVWLCSQDACERWSSTEGHARLEDQARQAVRGTGQGSS